MQVRTLGVVKDRLVVRVWCRGVNLASDAFARQVAVFRIEFMADGGRLLPSPSVLSFTGLNCERLTGALRIVPKFFLTEVSINSFSIFYSSLQAACASRFKSMQSCSAPHNTRFSSRNLILHA